MSPTKRRLGILQAGNDLLDDVNAVGLLLMICSHFRVIAVKPSPGNEEHTIDILAESHVFDEIDPGDPVPYYDARFTSDLKGWSRIGVPARLTRKPCEDILL